MLTTRIRPKISVKPLATTKNSAASVSPLSVTTANLRGSSAPLTISQITTSAAIAARTTRCADQRAAPAGSSVSGIVPAGPAESTASVTFLDSY